MFQIQASTKHVNESIAKQIHEKTAQVVAWLHTAEEESSREEGIILKLKAKLKICLQFFKP